MQFAKCKKRMGPRRFTVTFTAGLFWGIHDIWIHVRISGSLGMLGWGPGARAGSTGVKEEEEEEVRKRWCGNFYLCGWVIAGCWALAVGWTALKDRPPGQLIMHVEMCQCKVCKYEMQIGGVNDITWDSLVQGLALLVLLEKEKMGLRVSLGARWIHRWRRSCRPRRTSRAHAIHYMQVGWPFLGVSTECKFMILGRSDMTDTEC